MARLLAVDVGLRRVGVAVSDPSHTIATALTTLRNDGAASLAVAVASLCHQHGVTEVVLGLPQTGEGTDTVVTRNVRELATRLQRRGLAIHWIDEALSSREAEEVLDAHGTSASGKRRARQSGRVDQLAATIILERHLEAVQTARTEPGS